MERTFIPLREIKFASDGTDAMEFSGYGAVFGNVDAYGDVIVPGAFADTLAAAHKSGVFPAMLSQHGGWGMTAQDLTPVGVWSSLSEDGIGLKLDGDLEKDLVKRFKVAGYPTMVVVDATGKEAWRFVGYLSSKEVLEQLATIK